LDDVELIDKGSTLRSAARLEWKSFFAFAQIQLNGNRLQKRLGTEGGKAAQIITIKIKKA